MSIYIDETAHVSDKAKIGDGTKIWINVQVREEAERTVAAYREMER